MNDTERALHAASRRIRAKLIAWELTNLASPRQPIELARSEWNQLYRIAATRVAIANKPETESE